MRTIPLKEHETSYEALSRQELDELLRSDLVKVTPRLDGSYGIRPGSVVGTAAYRHLRLAIEPKVRIGNLLFLLSYGLGFTRWGPESFPYATAKDLVGAVAWLYAQEAADALRRGITRGYLKREEALPAPVGAIRFERQFALHQSRLYPVECDYEDFTADIRLNQLVKAAHMQLLRRPGTPVAVHPVLRHQLSSFADVSDVLFETRTIPRPTFNRVTEHWRGAAELARLILEGQTLAHREGYTPVLTFTINMNVLFERFVTAVVLEETKKEGFGFEAQGPRPFTQLVGLRPDLIVTADGTDVAVGDVKYKETEIADWPHADLYQIHAYCSTMGLSRGVVIYAGPRAPQQQRVVRAGVEIEIVGIDLGGDPGAVLKSARFAARRLIQAAKGGGAVHRLAEL